MPFSLILPVLLVVVAGAFAGLQGPTNALLARGAGSTVIGALISFAIGTAALAAIALVTRPRPAWGAMRELPPYAWAGGLYGAYYVFVFAYATPRLGVAMAVVIAALGQLIAALAIDQFGAFGVPRDPLTWTKSAGVVLVLLGIVLVRWK